MVGSKSPTPPLVSTDRGESENTLVEIMLSAEVLGGKDMAIGDTLGGVELLN